MKRMSRWVVSVAAAAGALLALTTPALARHHARHKPKISEARARATALARVPGEVVDHEYEREHGRWIYSFEIRPKGETGTMVKEVNVNADTGAVVNVETEHRRR